MPYQKRRMWIWLDDERPVPSVWADQGLIIFKTAESLLPHVEANEVEFIDFDHDLGFGNQTGYDLAKRIEELAERGSIDPIRFFVHSGNVVGGINIREAMMSAWRFWKSFK